MIHVPTGSPGDEQLLELNVASLDIAVGSGQFCEVLGNERITVLDVSAARPSLLWDGHLSKTERERVIETMRRRAASVRQVELDTMARTRWRLAWTIDAESFVLWDRLGRRLWLDDSMIHRRAHRSRARASADSVVATLSTGWLTRGVEIRLGDGSSVAIARSREVMTRIDPTYDFIDLTFDGSWAVQLARGLAASLGVAADCTAYE